MNRLSAYIFATIISASAIAILYFLSLIFIVPYYITAILGVIVSFFLFKRIVSCSIKNMVSVFFTICTIVAITLLVNRTYYIANKYGWWDAWYIWDLHAKYMAYPDIWKQLFKNLDGTHPDYPPLLPSVLAFFKKLSPLNLQWVISYGIHLTIMMVIPLLIFFETYAKSVFLAVVTLFLFVTNDYFIQDSMAQYADTLLGLLLLCAVVTIRYSNLNRKYVLLSTLFISLCPLVKNEGLIIMLVFIVFHSRVLFRRYNIKFTLLGIAVPVLFLLMFKLFYAPLNDMYEKQSAQTLNNIFDLSRYKLILSYSYKLLGEYFNPIKVGLIIYLLLLMLYKRWPHYQFIMLMCIMMAYLCIYLLTPYDLEWHLFTSLRRLMHQLVPATAFVLVCGISGEDTAKFQIKAFSKHLHL